MRWEQKKQAEDFLKLLREAHEEIRREIERGNLAAMGLLAQCQEGAIQLGNLIETKTEEGKHAATIPWLESYCETVYRLHEELGDAPEGRANGGRIHKKLRNALMRVEGSVRNDIKVRLEVVFFPYKASMWDSLESVWQAAEADPDCDAYVVPIPYYDRNGDGSLGQYHYEGNEFPSYVPVTYYERYPLEERRPDIAYIHNPYDQANLVTTVSPRFYAKELKKYVSRLVYIPYYSTTGGMAEAQERCVAYYHADYIVIQAEKYRKFFAPELPDGKFLPFGSPKFDRVIRMCGRPGPVPEDWEERMRGRKAYFYNTSLQGMLADPPGFLRKMAYVFHCFQGREDACLVWRPHPLLEPSLESLRPEYLPAYRALKCLFREGGMGIYDDTPDITATISHCDVYLGDGGTSVTSLFGMAGKPMFIFNNSLDCAPEEDDWRGEIVGGFQGDGRDEWVIAQGNKLYRSPGCDYRYEYYCDLSEYAGGGYYSRIIEVEGRLYACPGNAQDILLVGEGKVQRRIPLERYVEQSGAFAGAYRMGRYLLLIPLRYPFIVRYDTALDKVEYIKASKDVFVHREAGRWQMGGSCEWGEYLLLASPAGDRVLTVNSRTGTVGLLETGAGNGCGCLCMASDGKDVWMLPCRGRIITRWNPQTGETREYGGFPAGFACRELPRGNETEEQPFGQAVFSGKYVYLSPQWGNMFLRLDAETGEMEEWTPPFPVPEKEKNPYFIAGGRGGFLRSGDGGYRYFSSLDRKLYDVDLETSACREVEVSFRREELWKNAAGFCEESEWMQYACVENAFNSLADLLDGNISGQPFDRDRQLRAYGKIAANNDGTCGEKVHRFVCDSARSRM